MARYYITAYQICSGPEELPESTADLWNLFTQGFILDEEFSEDSCDLATMLYDEEFLKLSTIVDEEWGCTVLGFAIHLEKGDGYKAPLQLMWNQDDSGSDGAYMLAYPDSEISSSQDIEILTDEGVARTALGAWGEGTPYILSPTFVFTPDEYLRANEDPEFVAEFGFSEDMS